MVKKIIFLILFFFISSAVYAEKVEDIKLTGYVNDFANVISQEKEIEIYQIIENTEIRTTAEIVVLTINTTDGVDYREFAINIAEGKIGKKEKDNGVLIFLVVKDRKWSIEVGYGLEDVLNDAKVGRIGRDLMVPFFKEGNYQDGLYNGVKEISNILLNKSDFNYTAYQQNLKKQMLKIEIINTVIFLLIILVFIFIATKAKKFKGKKKLSDGEFLAAIWAASTFSKRGSGGFSGGFGGLGGGSFGGGGAGGSF